jgi:hypothetical protein
MHHAFCIMCEKKPNLQISFRKRKCRHWQITTAQREDSKIKPYGASPVRNTLSAHSGKKDHNKKKLHYGIMAL